LNSDGGLTAFYQPSVSVSADFDERFELTMYLCLALLALAFANPFQSSPEQFRQRFEAAEAQRRAGNWHWLAGLTFLTRL
jgi:hypothetical protein